MPFNDIFLIIADDRYWHDIAKFRRHLQRLANGRLIFIDKTAVYCSIYPRRALVASRNQPLILVEKLSAYSQRCDFIGAINGSQSIACMILTPNDRKVKGIKGIRKHMVNDWITNTLAPAINALNIDNIYLIWDRSRAHHKESMMKALKNAKCKSVLNIYFMPTASAKYVSSLDNPKEQVHLTAKDRKGTRKIYTHMIFRPINGHFQKSNTTKLSRKL